MDLNKREFLQIVGAASVAGMNLDAWAAADADRASAALYDIPAFGNVSFLHITDCHAQLKPIHFREPSVNLGIGDMAGRVPHLVGNRLLEHFKLPAGSREAYAFTCLDFEKLAGLYGKVGGFAHLATLVKRVRANRPGALLLDGGDTWQGSGTALWTQGQDMVEAAKLLGVDIMTLHWECTYGQDRVKEIAEKDFAGHIEIVAQNIKTADFGDDVFKPYSLRNVNGVPVAVIGQAFPYTPIANPRYMVADWTFGIREAEMQATVDAARAAGAAVVVVLSHKLATELAPNHDAGDMLGRDVRVRGRAFTVVGVMPAFTGENGFQIFIPLRAAAAAFGSTQRLTPTILVRAPSLELVDATKARVIDWLATRYRDWESSIRVATQLLRLEQARTAMVVLKLVMGAFAAISLLVGGVGIMNVLLAGVTERTREIGVRKAMGARRRDILQQFLAESVAMAGVGTGIGTVVGLAAAFAVAGVVRWQVPGADLHATVTTNTHMIAIIAAVSIGLAFGTFPALRAARLSPIDAIRHE